MRRKPRERNLTHKAASQGVAQLDRFEELSRSLGDNALLQAKVNEALATHILKLEQMVQQGQFNSQNSIENLQISVRGMDTRLGQMNDRISDNTAAWRRVAVPVGNDLWLTRILDRFLMYVETRDMSVAPYLVIDGRWEKTLTDAFIERMKAGMVIVDVGANYGYYTLLAASYVFESGRVYSFEPNPRTFEILMKNVHVNWLTKAVEAHCLAILDTKKQVPLNVLREFQGGSSLFEADFIPEAATPREERPMVEALPLDEIVKEKVDLIKIDAEGSEPLVYAGMKELLRRSPRLTIFMEFCPSMLRQTVEPKEFLNQIRTDGFSLRWFTPWNTLETFDEEKAFEYHMFNLLLERNQTACARQPAMRRLARAQSGRGQVVFGAPVKGSAFGERAAAFRDDFLDAKALHAFDAGKTSI
jgi:FkbM family methyltransferase